MDRQTYLQALGLLTLSQQHYEKMKWCEKALSELLGIKPTGNYYGHLSDAIWQGETNLDELLRKLEVDLDSESRSTLNPPDELS